MKKTNFQLEDDPNKRPSINGMIKIFYTKCFAKVKFESIKVQNIISLLENQNVPEINFSIGKIYYEGKYVTRNINKAIHYYSLAANQNHPNAQFNLGTIYYKGEYVTQNINKAIQYFTLAANHSIPEEQFVLGIIYFLGEHIKQGIKKGLYCIMLASMNNFRKANFFARFFASPRNIC